MGLTRHQRTEYFKKYNEVHREERARRGLAYRMRNREKIREAQSKYRATHREMLRAIGKRSYDSGRRFLDAVKSICGCGRCGYNRSTRALDFHHLGAKRFNVGRSAHQAWGTLVSEVMSCEILCANCHREVTHD